MKFPPSSAFLRLAVVFLLLAVAVKPALAYPPVYSAKHVVHLSELAAGGQSLPMSVAGLNDDGLLAGFYAYTSKDQGRTVKNVQAFVWNDPAASLVNLADYGYASSLATCVCAAGGYVAGVGWTNGSAGPRQYGFLWQGGVCTSFLAPADLDVDSVVAVNGSGWAVGTYFPVDAEYQRAFLWDGTQSVDLGDLGEPDNSFVWPAALNDAGQVVGTVYAGDTPSDSATSGAPRGGQPSATSSPAPPQASMAFRWENGTMTALDLDYSSTLGLNRWGEAVGTYHPPASNGPQLLPRGFFWTGSNHADLGDLGAGGTAPFGIDADSQVTGTGYTADHLLHLFGWNPSVPILDQGLARVSADDTAFQLTGVNRAGDAVGFVSDAQGNPQVFVRGGRTGSLSRVDSTMTTTTGVTANNVPGQVALINAAGLVAYAGRDATGAPVALLLTADADGNGLPDGWEVAFFGHTGVVPGDDDDGDGQTNLQEFQQGTNPRDYYNGHDPVLIKTAGDNQNGYDSTSTPPTARALNAFSVHATDPASGTGRSNLSIRFAVPGSFTGVQLGTDAVFTSAATSLQTLTNAQGDATVYVRMPDGVPALNQTISAAVDHGGNSVVFTVLVPGGDDSDHNGLADAWEIAHFGSIGQDPNADFDDDGLTNAQEMEEGTDPKSPDTDNDGVPDGQDAVPLDPELKILRYPLPTNYAVIDLNEFYPVGINNIGQMAGYNGEISGVWSKGLFYVYNGGIPAHDNWLYTVVEDVFSASGIDDQGNYFFNDDVQLSDGLHGSDISKVYTSSFSGSNFGAPSCIGDPSQQNDQSINLVDPAGVVVGNDTGVIHYHPGDSGYRRTQEVSWRGGYGGYGNLPDANDQICTFGSDYTYDNTKGYDDLVFPEAINSLGQMVGRTSEGTEYSLDALVRPFTSNTPREIYNIVWGTGSAPTVLDSPGGGSATGISSLQIATGNLAPPNGATLWLGEKNWKRKNLPLLKQASSAKVHAQTMNGHGQLLVWDENLGACLWQNIRLFPFSELAVDTRYTNIEPWRIDDSGAITGTAEKVDDGSTHQVLLIPAEFQTQAGKINQGFDPPMNGVTGTDPLGHPYTVPDDPVGEPAWTSVVQGSVSNTVEFDLAKSFAPSVQLKITAGGDHMSLSAPTPEATLSSDKNPMTISGATTATGGVAPALEAEVEGEIQAQLIGDSQVLRTLKVAILPRRIISIGIYRVIDPTSSLTYPLDNAPSDQTILAELNTTYQQAGIHFVNANPHTDSKDDITIPINYDLNIPTDDPNTTRLRDGLVQDADDDAIESYFITNNPPGDAWVVLTKNSGIIYNDGNPPLYEHGSSVHSDDSPSYSNIFCNANSPTIVSIPLVVAHEIGHDLDISVVLSVQHPGHDYGPYPPGIVGLMNPGGDAGLPIGRWLRHEDWIRANNYAQRFNH